MLSYIGCDFARENKKHMQEKSFPLLAGSQPLVVAWSKLAYRKSLFKGELFELVTHVNKHFIPITSEFENNSTGSAFLGSTTRWRSLHA